MSKQSGTCVWCRTHYVWYDGDEDDRAPLYSAMPGWVCEDRDRCFERVRGLLEEAEAERDGLRAVLNQTVGRLQGQLQPTLQAVYDNAGGVLGDDLLLDIIMAQNVAGMICRELDAALRGEETGK